MSEQTDKNFTDPLSGSFDYLTKAASPTDCTGLIPSAPQNDYEWESYENVYPFLTPYVDQRPDADSDAGKRKAPSASSYTLYEDLPQNTGTL